MNNLTTFYIVRHAESYGNVSRLAGKDGGETTELGTGLTERGKEQANDVAGRFENVAFDKVFSSELIRAKHTAEIIASTKKLEVTALEILKERDYGSYSTRLLELKEKMRGLLDNFTEQEKMEYKYSPDIESPEETASRFLTFLRETALAYLGKTVLVVSHGNMLRYLLVKLGYASYDELPSDSIVNTGYFIVESDGVDFFVKETHGVHKKHV